MNGFLIHISRFLWEIFKVIIYFPLWWYGPGLWRMVIALKNFLLNREKELALRIWLKNIFRPMYGQADWIGRLISFLMRIFQIAARAVFLIFWLAASGGALALWLIFPPLVIWEIIFQLT